MDIEAVATQMVVLFLIVTAGFAARKCGLMGGEFDKKLSSMVIYLTCPCLVLASTMGDEMPEGRLILPLLGISTLTYAVLIGVAYAIPRFIPLWKKDVGMYQFMLVYANVGFIGYPIIASLFGHSSVFYACILNVPNTLSIFIWGQMFVAGKAEGGFHWKLLWSPAMVATYLSIVVVTLGWRVPTVVSQPLTLIGQMTVPSSLLVIGSSMAAMPILKMLGGPATYVMCLFRLLLVPVGIYHLMYALGASHHVAAINAVLVGMPVASFGTMFCMRYGKDATAMTQGTFVSTLLSVASIPLLALLMA